MRVVGLSFNMKATAKRSNKWKPSFDIVVLEARYSDVTGWSWTEISRPVPAHAIPNSDKLLRKAREYAQSIGLSFNQDARAGAAEFTDIELLALSFDMPVTKTSPTSTYTNADTEE